MLAPHHGDVQATAGSPLGQCATEQTAALDERPPSAMLLGHYDWLAQPSLQKCRKKASQELVCCGGECCGGGAARGREESAKSQGGKVPGWVDTSFPDSKLRE